VELSNGASLQPATRKTTEHLICSKNKVAKGLELRMPTTNFIWDELSDNVLLESDDSDAVTAAYVNRPEQFGELLSQDRSGAKTFFHFDGESTTSALTDANENITDTFIFTAYGEEVARTGTTTNPFGYKGAVGYYTDESTSDIYVRNRTYEPTIGSWLSTDPLGFVDGTSLYRAYFVPNETDPSGKFIMNEVRERFIFSFTATERNRLWLYYWERDFYLFTITEEIKPIDDGMNGWEIPLGIPWKPTAQVVWLQEVSIDAECCGPTGCEFFRSDIWEWWNLRKRDKKDGSPLVRPWKNDKDVNEIRWGNDYHVDGAGWYCDCTWNVRVLSSIGIVVDVPGDRPYGVLDEPKPINPSAKLPKPAGSGFRWIGPIHAWGYDVECALELCLVT
jgi:RHS repeat-associated protein